MDLLDKLRAIEKRRATFAPGDFVPGQTTIERVLGPGEVLIAGKPTLMFGSNNYLGLTLHPDVTEAARAPSSNTGPAPPARGPRTARSVFTRISSGVGRLVRQAHAIIFSTGYQANLSLIGGLCGAGDVILDRPRQPREHLRRDPADRGPGHRLPPQLGAKPAQEAGAPPREGTQPAGRRRGAVFHPGRRGAAS
jgi:7-keto-8-aminopelargonate synthetase and related enzymes